MNSKALREKRANLAEQSKAILDKATAENRELNAEETQSFDKIHADMQALLETIERVERQEAVDVELRASRGTVAGREDTSVVNDGGENVESRAKQYEDAFNGYLRFGMEGIEPEQRALLRSGWRTDESRAAQTVTTTAGGYLIPVGFSGQLEESMKEFGGMREAATVFQTESGNDLNWPTVDDTAQVGELLAINTAAAEQAVTYGQVQFKSYKYSSKLVLVPIELSQDSAFDLNGHLAGVLGTRIGRITNTHFTTGDGSGKPLGIVAGASSGVTAAGTATVTADELMDLVHSIDPAYRKLGAKWMFNDKSLKALKKLKDGEGRPLWQAGLSVKEPDNLLGYGYVINQDVADLATGSKSILFGALNKYFIRDIMGITVLRLVERYAELAQIGFLAFSRHDGRVLDAGTDPVKYITQA